MDTPELSHSPSKYAQRNGTTASTQAGLGLRMLKLDIRLETLASASGWRTAMDPS